MRPSAAKGLGEGNCKRINKYMRLKKLAWNTIASLVFQVTSLICGFVLPQLILHSFGSEVNGLVNSIAQFLSVIALLELGVGAVIQSSLYEPLAKKDDILVSRIIASGSNFFKRIAQILSVYVVVMIVAYPRITNKRFGHIYTAALIVAMCINSFAQYYFGIIDRLLLSADQKGYIHYVAQSVTLIVNTISCVALILQGVSIHIIKLVTSIIFLLCPLVIRLYVNRNYKLNRRIKYDEEPIKQKWNGIAQHVAAFILGGTDNIVLTVFSTFINVSIYSVYNLIIYGVKNLFLSLINGIQPLMGEMLAGQELKALTKLFSMTEWLIHTGVTFIFGCTAMLIVPFVSVYTNGVTDANYEVPVFAAVLTTANAVYCLRLPYNILILAGGHYKQTQNNYIIAAVLNIVISIMLVIKWGLIGVAVGTLIAMSYQTIWMAYYDSKNLIGYPIGNFIKQLLVDLLSVCCGVALTRGFVMNMVSYMSWIVLSVKTAAVWSIVILIMNTIFYRNNMLEIIRYKMNDKLV